MLFCFRLFYFRFKSFLRTELKCDITAIHLSHRARGVSGMFYPLLGTRERRLCQWAASPRGAFA